MEIKQAGIEFGDLSAQKWALVQLARKQRFSGGRAEQVREQLSQLLYGLDLDLGQLQSYRSKLLQALDLADQLTELPGEVSLEEGRIPADKKIYRMGALVWHPTQVTHNPVTTSAEHQIHNLALLNNMERAVEAMTSSGRRVVHRVGIVVASNFEGVRAGADEVELSSTGFEVLHDPGPENVVHLRLPPRFPSHADFITAGVRK